MPKNGQITKKLVDVRKPHECWIWLGSTNKKTGYGKKQIGGRPILAHRWVYETFHGPIDENCVINHICGVRNCVNPTHLEAVSQAINCRKGNGTKLKEHNVKAILAAKDDPYVKDYELANMFGVSRGLIQDIWGGRAWRGIT